MDIPDRLIQLDRAAEAQRLRFREGARNNREWVEAADAALNAIADHAQATGVSRVELEMAVKAAARSSSAV